MCGFYMSVTKNVTDGIDINFVKDELSDRGPDNFSYNRFEWNGYSILLCHSRLSISDTGSESNQPYIYNSIFLLFNGEIYNYKRLRNILEKRYGYLFNTNSDTEVIVKGYHRFGKNIFNYFDGPYSIIILDLQNGVLITGRDSFGEKPLFYHSSERMLSFSSKPRLLKKKNTKYDLRFIYEFIRYGYSISNRTVYKNVFLMDNCKIDVYSLFTLKKNTDRYQSHNSMTLKKISFETFKVKFFNTFKESLKDRLVFDKSIEYGLLLSGGIDSCFIAAFASKELGISFKCYTIDDGSNKIEIERAIKLCELLHLEHKIISSHRNFTNKNCYVPMSDPAYTFLCQIYDSVPKNNKVIFTGDGSDEIFLSYSNYFNLSTDKFDNVSKSIFLKFLNTIFSNGILLRLGFSREFLLYNKIHEFYPYEKNLSINLIRKFAVNYDLSKYLTIKTDSSSMNYSIEARSPFLNKKLFRLIDTQDINFYQYNKKTFLSEYINEVCNYNFSFSKDGMAAGQQRKSNSIFKNILNILFNDYYYRFGVLKKWLSEHEF